MSAAPRRPALEVLAWAGVLGIALMPSLPALGAAWIAEDASILGYVDRRGPFSDWCTSQYDLDLVRFWRPVITTLWWVQERLLGTDALLLRFLNLGAHVFAVLLAGAVLRAAGASALASLLAAALVASFPDQGGTVTWLAGRTDLVCGALVLGAVVCSLRGASLASGILAFLACASKEFAFALPVWAASFLWARRATQREFVRGFLPVLGATLAAFVWRSLALQEVAGGYPLAVRDLSASELPRAAWHLARSLGPLLPALGVLGLLGGLSGALAPRLFVAGLAAGAAALVPLLPLARHGVLEAQNARLLFVADLGFALAAGAALARKTERRFALGLTAAAGLALVGWRSGEALADTLEWDEAAAVATREAERARSALRGAGASDLPVLASGFPVAWKGAYCLGFGAADRFRAPFDPTPRPVWPLRPLFGFETSARAMAVSLRADGTLWPFDDPRSVAFLALLDGEGTALDRLGLDERSFLSESDRSPRIHVAGAPHGARLEVVAFTELGYEPARLAPAEISLMRLLASSNGVASIGETLRQAADVGATRAYLEFRAVGNDGELLAASPWVEVVWDPALRKR